MRAADRSYPSCAAPVPPPAAGRGAARTVLAVVVAVGLLAGAGAAAWFALHGRPDVPAAAPVAAPRSTADRPLPRPVQPTAPRPAADPTTALDARANADRPVAEESVGSWVPQISSKVAGLEVDGVVYDDARILAEFQDAQSRYGAILVRSGDFSTFQRAGLWVVLVPQPSADADAANAWCDREGFAPGDCYAKRLSHTDGPAGNSKPRS